MACVPDMIRSIIGTLDLRDSCGFICLLHSESTAAKEVSPKTQRIRQQKASDNTKHPESTSTTPPMYAPRPALMSHATCVPVLLRGVPDQSPTMASATAQEVCTASQEETRQFSAVSTSEKDIRRIASTRPFATFPPGASLLEIARALATGSHVAGIESATGDLVGVLTQGHLMQFVVKDLECLGLRVKSVVGPGMHVTLDLGLNFERSTLPVSVSGGRPCLPEPHALAEACRRKVCTRPRLHK